MWDVRIRYSEYTHQVVVNTLARPNRNICFAVELARLDFPWPSLLEIKKARPRSQRLHHNLVRGTSHGSLLSASMAILNMIETIKATRMKQNHPKEI